MAVTYPLVSLNGALLPASEARIGILDHGLLYGDGLFETLAVREGLFFRMERHLARLAESARRLELELPWGEEALAAALRETARANGIREGILRLTVTRGEGPPLPDPVVCSSPAFFITARPLPAGGRSSGLSVCLAGRHPRTFVPGIKALSYLPFQAARQAARKRGCDDGLLVDGDRVVEASASNLFLVRGGALLTPDLESGCLPGIAREAVLELARAGGIPLRETPVPVAWLEDADEVFLTNSVTGIAPVARLEQRLMADGSPGPLTTRLRDGYLELVRREGQA